jgi:Inner membrane component of T3SS, cytoplasmic domain
MGAASAPALTPGPSAPSPLGASASSSGALAAAASATPPPALSNPIGGGYFPPTGAIPEKKVAPPSPFGPAGAKLIGTEGEYTVRPSAVLALGRDPTRCQIVLSDPRISALHAKLKFEGGVLLVMDDGSNNGVYIDGVRQPERIWQVVAQGSLLRIGPYDFQVVIL